MAVYISRLSLLTISTALVLCRSIVIDCSATNDANCVSQTLSADQIECSGTSSCQYASMTVVDGVICSGANSCDHSTICNGRNACDPTYGNTGKDAKEKRQQTSHNETRVNGGTVWCSGVKSCHKAKFKNILKLHATGDHALEDAVLSNANHEGTSYYMYGFAAGQGATILCDTNSPCNIKCRSNACQNLQVDIKEGGPFSVDITPSCCTQIFKGTWSGICDNTICPIEGAVYPAQQSIDDIFYDLSLTLDDTRPSDEDLDVMSPSSQGIDGSPHVEAIIMFLVGVAVGFVGDILRNLCVKKLKLQSEYESIL